MEGKERIGRIITVLPFVDENVLKVTGIILKLCLFP